MDGKREGFAKERVLTIAHKFYDNGRAFRDNKFRGTEPSMQLSPSSGRRPLSRQLSEIIKVLMSLSRLHDVPNN